MPTQPQVYPALHCAGSTTAIKCTIEYITPHTVPAQKSNIIKKMSVGKSLTFSFIMIIRRLLLFARLSYYFSPVHTIYQAHRLLTSGLKAHKVVHASLGSRFGQQDLYLPILIEILMIYFFQYGSFGGSVALGLPKLRGRRLVSRYFQVIHTIQNIG